MNKAGIKLIGLIFLLMLNIVKPMINNNNPPTLVISVTIIEVKKCLNNPAKITKND